MGVSRLRNSSQEQMVTTAVVQLEYDGQGLLLRITDNGTMRWLVRDRVDQLARPLVETDAAGNPVRWFVWANGRLLAQVGTNSLIRVAHFDELGRLLAFTDNTGALTDEFAYHPYGRLIAHSGTTATPTTWLGAYGVWDAGHGLYLTRHRAYDANLMRFLQVDPLGISGGLNLYVYGNGNPMFFLDVLGLCADNLTLSEANRHYREGGGTPITVDASSIRITGVNSSDFSGVGDTELYRTRIFSASGDFFVYGNIRLVYAGGNQINILPDNYGFEMHEGRPFRNFETRIGSFIAGEGTPYDIHFEGTVPINP